MEAVQVAHVHYQYKNKIVVLLLKNWCKSNIMDHAMFQENLRSIFSQIWAKKAKKGWRSWKRRRRRIENLNLGFYPDVFSFLHPQLAIFISALCMAELFSTLHMGSRHEKWNQFLGFIEKESGSKWNKEWLRTKRDDAYLMYSKIKAKGHHPRFYNVKTKALFGFPPR